MADSRSVKPSFLLQSAVAMMRRSDPVETRRSASTVNGRRSDVQMKPDINDKPRPKSGILGTCDLDE